MTVEDAVAAFGRLPVERQIRLVASFAHKLTLAARGTYEAGTERIADPARIRALNEIQHRVIGQLLKLLDDDEARYPDDVFVDIATDGGDPELVEAFACDLGR